ncbi:MAG TPA: hypothetical protein VLE44_02420 [Candidatus Saccharimonadales bacterium]|nr:hypothetical protein [Candidatus Saccharimonadales bacterium]
MVKRIFRLLLLFFVVFFGGIGVFLYTQKDQPKTTADLENVKLPTVVVAESPDASQTSPDGKRTLTMKTVTSGDLTTYSFTDGSTVLFTKTLPKDSKMGIPSNTWSPDDKKFFVKETNSGNTNYYVIPGEDNVADLFKQKYPAATLQEITGWADPGLLILNVNIDGKDASFWYELTSKSFIRLSNRFN